MTFKVPSTPLTNTVRLVDGFFDDLSTCRHAPTIVRVRLDTIAKLEPSTPTSTAITAALNAFHTIVNGSGGVDYHAADAEAGQS